jgi:hypothetical protein
MYRTRVLAMEQQTMAWFNHFVLVHHILALPFADSMVKPYTAKDTNTAHNKPWYGLTLSGFSELIHLTWTCAGVSFCPQRHHCRL